MENHIYQIWLAECNAAKAITMANLLLSNAQVLRRQLGLKSKGFTRKQLQQFNQKKSLEDLFQK